MSALPSGTPDPISDQDHTHARIRTLLTTVTEAILAEQPQLSAFTDHRPERDRPSGTAWRGLATMCHVSALLASSRPPEGDEDGARRLLERAGAAARHGDMRLRTGQEDLGTPGASRMTWSNAGGDLLEVVVGVRLTVRAISAPFLPGSLDPMSTTSPPSPVSPLTPPPRLLR